MSDPIAAIICRLARPLAPEPTGEAPVLPRLQGVRAVLFDLYGTLFISASGDIVATASKGEEQAFDDAAALCGLLEPPAGSAAVERLDSLIRSRHAVAKSDGIEYPEIEILDVWREVFAELSTEPPDAGSLRRFATVYENLVNPVWSMPGCRETLERLRNAGLVLGAISNAQFYTPPLFEALLGASGDELGVRGDLQFYSYQTGRAKPGRDLFDRAAARLDAMGITIGETLFVGNDLLNDIMPAWSVGFRTALFAGDRRSYRTRDGDVRVAGVTPDVVLTELPQLLDVLGIAGGGSD